MEDNNIKIKDLFAKDINRPIEGVIKAADDKGLREEIDEYVLTGETTKHLEAFLEAYTDGLNHNCNGAWISGFFGSGKSHLLKMLAHILGDVPETLVAGHSGVTRQEVIDAFIEKAGSEHPELQGLLRKASTIPCTSVLFNIDQKADKQANDPVLSTFIRVFNEACGYYGKEPYIAKFERDLDKRGLLQTFTDKFMQETNISWEQGLDTIFLYEDAVNKAYDEATGNTGTNIMANYEKSDSATIDDFVDVVKEWLDKQGKDSRIIFFADEIGQFIGDKTDRMLTLQTITETLNTKLKNRAWVVVTSQEDMDGIIGSFSKRNGTDFSKIQGRFDVKLKLNSTDVIEVIQKRMLEKKTSCYLLLDGLWQREQANMRTLFDFDGATAAFSNSSTKTDESDFVASYPFMNYQFGLFQASLQKMSDQNVFNGQHQSVGERSMLSVTREALRSFGNHIIGELIPFDKFFDGVQGSIKSEVNRTIANAYDRLDTNVNELAARILKVLILIKYVDGIPGTVKNIRVLLTDGFGADIAAQEEQITNALKVLERQTYVRRDGEAWEYLTDEEKDVEQEIKNVSLSANDISAKLAEFVNDAMVPDTKSVKYGSLQRPFRYGLKVDGERHSNDAPIWIDIITPLNGETSDDIRQRSIGDNETVYLLLDDSDVRIIDDFYMYLRADKYTKHNDVSQMSPAKKRIVIQKSDENRGRYQDLIKRLADAALHGKLYYNSKELSVSPRAGGSAKDYVESALLELISSVYVNFSLLGSYLYNKHTLEEVVKDVLDDRNAAVPNLPPLLDTPSKNVVDKVTADKRELSQSTVKTLIDYFDKAPYGWPENAVTMMIAYQATKGELDLETDGGRVDPKKIPAVLNDRKKWEHTKVSVPRQWNQKLVFVLRNFAKESLGMTDSDVSVAPLNLASAAKEAMHKTASELLSAQVPTGLEPVRQRLAGIASDVEKAAKHDDDWILTTFVSGDESEPTPADGLAQELDEAHDIREFLQNQGADTADAINWYRRNGDNISAIDDVEKAVSLTWLDSVMSSKNLWKSGQMLRKGIDSLRSQVENNVRSARGKANDAVEQVSQRIHSSEEWNDATEQAQKEADTKLADEKTKISSIHSIRQLDEEYRFVSDSLHPQIINALLKSTAPAPAPAPTPTPVSTPMPVPEPSPSRGVTPVAVSVRADELSLPREISRGKTALADVSDVDEFLAEYRQKLIDAIHSGKKILL